MFKRPTVFIVGAGASNEVGFPTGPGLATDIANNLSLAYEEGRGSPFFHDHELHAQIRRKLYKDERHQLPKYMAAAKRIHEGVTLSFSIDDFLNVHSGDPYIVEVGKASIVRAVLQAEQKSNLYFDQSNTYHRMDFRKCGTSWFPRLMRILTQGSKPTAIEEIFYNVTFIVFNYDRCLEHFLECALRAVYGLERDKAVHFVQTATIIHPYGKIGELESLPFGGHHIDEPDLLEAAKQIRTYSERFEEETVLEQIRKEVTEAACVVYLGFSFLEQNMNLLRPAKRVEDRPVFGTAYGMSPNDRDVVQSEIIGTFRNADMYPDQAKRLVELDDIKCAQLFDNYAKSLNVSAK